MGDVRLKIDGQMEAAAGCGWMKEQLGRRQGLSRSSMVQNLQVHSQGLSEGQRVSGFDDINSKDSFDQIF